jgi:DNA repair protein RecO (recombination protein O)
MAGSGVLGAELVTHAVVLGQVTSGESDRVVTLFSARVGKLAAIARGAHRSRQRFGAALAPLVLGEARLRERRGSDLMWLEQFTAIEDFTALASDPVKWAHASYATELLRELVVPRQEDQALLALLLECYRALGQAPPSADLLRGFELAVLGAVGLRPELARCLGCQSVDPADLDASGAMLDPERGGVLCASCAQRERGSLARLLPAIARARLVEVQGLPLAAAGILPSLPPLAAAAARAAVHAVTQVHLPRPLRSLDFVAQLNDARRS